MKVGIYTLHSDVAVQSGFRPSVTFEGWSRVHVYSEEYGLPDNVRP